MLQLKPGAAKKKKLMQYNVCEGSGKKKRSRFQILVPSLNHYVMWMRQLNFPI